MKFRTPIFIQASLGNNAQPIEELCARWNHYGETLNILTSGELQKIVVYLPNSDKTQNLSRFKNLEINFIQDTLFGRFWLFWKLQRQINNLNPDYVTLIAGDLYISPLIARSLKFIFKKRVGVQVQFHGATYKNHVGGLRTRLKFWLMKGAVSSSDSIRIVSSFQQREIQAKFDIYSKEFVVSPIPISLAKIPTTRTSHQGLFLLILGRLHPERGIGEILKFIEMLVRGRVECTIDVVGEGPLKQLFEPHVNNTSGATKVILHGQKNEMEVKGFLAKSDLLISLAPEEGYGLALREAVLSGVHVLARRNNGTSDVLSRFPGRIDLIENASEAFEFVKRFKPIDEDPGELAEIRNDQEVSDLRNIEALVMSWIKP
jgi:glycosyltransferase involved in cell wall biosynthesis